MENLSKKQSIASKVFSIEKVNPFFSKVKIYVMYEGLNRNGSFLSREAIDKALPTIFNTPIVGEYLVEEKNFGTHGASVIKSAEGEYEMVLSTRPYGVVPESASIYWEAVTEDDGSQRDYLVIDGAYLWSGRYPELQTFLDEGYYGQSMEIEVVNGNYAIKEGAEVFEVQDFIFTAFCLLGIDKESDMFGHVEPAFEKAKVELVTYSLDKDSFKTQFNQMIDELKFTLQEGAKQTMEDNQAQNDLQERLGANVEANVEPETEPVVETPVTEPTEGTQEGTEGTQEAPEGEGETNTPEGETFAQEGAEGVTEGAEIEPEGGEATDGEEEVLTVTLEEHEALKANLEATQTELAELRTYKRNRELGDLKERFSTQVSEKELQAIFETNQDANIEKLEVEIFALIGKKNFSLETKTNNKVQVIAPKATENESASPYGSIFN